MLSKCKNLLWKKLQIHSNLGNSLSPSKEAEVEGITDANSWYQWRLWATLNFSVNFNPIVTSSYISFCAKRRKLCRMRIGNNLFTLYLYSKFYGDFFCCSIIPTVKSLGTKECKMQKLFLSAYITLGRVNQHNNVTAPPWKIKNLQLLLKQALTHIS